MKHSNADVNFGLYQANMWALQLSRYSDYGLNGPGSNPGGDEIFRLSRSVLGPTQPPVKWVPGLPTVWAIPDL